MHTESLQVKASEVTETLDPNKVKFNGKFYEVVARRGSLVNIKPCIRGDQLPLFLRDLADDDEAMAILNRLKDK